MITDPKEDAKNAASAGESTPNNELPVTLENPAFAAGQMVTCEACARSNPPTRLSCFYCGKDLPVTLGQAELVRPSLRRLENWEKGFNVIALGVTTDLTPAGLQSVAAEVGLDVAVAAKIFAAGGRLPLARVESKREAQLICSRLKTINIKCGIVSDEVLDPETLPRRLHGIEIEEAGIVLIDFNTRDRRTILASEIMLIVTGTLFEARTESFEQRKKGKAKIIDQSETSKDESVIDLYSRGERGGFRILETGFDFSCLGREKGLLAADNMPRLLRRLSNAAPAAKVVETYSEVQQELASVWELVSRKNFEGLRRSGFGKSDFGNVVTVNNLQQFNRFSRIQRFLI